MSLKVVAEMAGLSPSTVSRVLRGDEGCYISERKREKIFSVCKDLDYTPNLSARSLATGRTFHVAYVLCFYGNLDEHNPYLAIILNNLHEELRKKNYFLSVVKINYRDMDEFQGLCRSRGLFDGLVFARDVVDPPAAALLEKSGMPAVILDEEGAHLERFSRVTTDKFAGILRAVEHLRELGHSEIAFFGFGEHMELFRRAVEESGLESHEDMMFRLKVSCSHHFVLDSYLQSEKAVEDSGRFTAVLCVNDFAAFGLCRRLKERGITPGREVSVVGFDNIEDVMGTGGEFLTTVHKPSDIMGREAAVLLLEQIEKKPQEPRAIHIPCSLVLRSSTGPCRPGGARLERGDAARVYNEVCKFGKTRRA